ncbi:transposase (plasmid) [Hydrogenophilus thermoluteolus]|uniref:Transposase n=1 Tax=Hydrogenophilus thermoluteolus TaxID=297 RepID=A0A2Z6E0P9_HYDTE|nr:transposase [Hydrogenophilus thermoluteolus]
MGKDNTVALSMPEGMEDPLTELLRNGARRLIQQAIEAELAEMLAKYEGQADEQGRCQPRPQLTAFHRFEMSGFQRNAAWLPRP